jgi:hypothetical protein
VPLDDGGAPRVSVAVDVAVPGGVSDDVGVYDAVDD